MKLKGERIVYRSWVVTDDLSLKSTGAGETIWKKEMKAECKVDYAAGYEQDGHSAPHGKCECGLYGIYEPDKRHSNVFSFVHGAIAVSGQKVLIGPTGVRAEHARIVLLAHTDSSLNKVIVREVARHYGVPYCGLDELEKLALEFGSPIEDELKPKTQTHLSNEQLKLYSNHMGTLGAYTGGVTSGYRSFNAPPVPYPVPNPYPASYSKAEMLAFQKLMAAKRRLKKHRIDIKKPYFWG